MIHVCANFEWQFVVLELLGVWNNWGDIIVKFEIWVTKMKKLNKCIWKYLEIMNETFVKHFCSTRYIVKVSGWS